MNHFTTKEAADRLGVQPVTIRKAIRQSRLTAHKFGHIWMVLEDAGFHRFVPGTPGRPRKAALKWRDRPMPCHHVVAECTGTPSLYIERYKRGPYFAVYEGDSLLCVTVYRKGAEAVRQRLVAALGAI